MANPTRKPPVRRWSLWAAIAVLLAIGGCSSAGEPAAEEPPGNPEVYARIAAMTDCAQLQAEFDQAAANNEREQPGTPLFGVTLGYMEATDERMQVVGCY